MSVSAEIQKDFDALAEFTGTASFTYCDIHNENVQTDTHYDISSYIKKTTCMLSHKKLKLNIF